MGETTLYTVTFVFPDAVVTTSITGDHAITERASARLKMELGIDTIDAIEVSIHEHP